MKDKIYEIYSELINSKKYEKEFVKINHARATYIIILIYLSEWIVYFNSTKFLGVGKVVLFFQILMTLIIPLMIISYIRFESISVYWHKILHLLCIYALIALSVGFVFMSENPEGVIHVYLIITMGVAAIIYLHPLYSALVIALPTILFVIGIINVINNEMRYVYIFNTIIFNVLAFGISVNLFYIKVRDFNNREKIKKHNKELKELSRIDQMSGLYNHEAILNILLHKIKSNEDIMIILFDIDNFKKINDKFGHTEGDKVIKKVAFILKEIVGNENYVGRYGGEEFLVVLSNKTVKETKILYNNYINAISKEFKEKEYKITLSGGVAQFHKHSINELIKEADEKLYIAKRTGKNKIIFNHYKRTEQLT